MNQIIEKCLPLAIAAEATYGQGRHLRLFLYVVDYLALLL